MAHQLSFGEAEYSIESKKSRKGVFLRKMNAVVPWSILNAIIEPYYPKVPEKAGRRPYPLETMLRIHLLQHFYNLSDPAMESELHDSIAMRKFSKLGSLRKPTPDETTILNFRHLLEKNELSRRIFDAINKYLGDKGLRFSGGSIVDATMIDAPSSTKNRSNSRDPEMHSTKKGNQYYFGEKIHIGVDAQSGAIHSVAVTSANVHDIAMTDEVIREKDKYVFADSGYRGISKRTRHKNVAFLVSMMRSKRKQWKGTLLDDFEKLKSSIRSKVEHAFRILKDQFNYRKVRYRGLYKNTQAAYLKCGLINLYKFRNYLLSRA